MPSLQFPCVKSTCTLKCLCQALVQQLHTPTDKSAKGETWNVDVHLYMFTYTSLHMVHRLCLSMANASIRLPSHMVVFLHELVQNPLFISYTRKNLRSAGEHCFKGQQVACSQKHSKKPQNTNRSLKPKYLVDCIKSFIYDKDFWIHEIWNIYLSSDLFFFVSNITLTWLFRMPTWLAWKPCQGHYLQFNSYML